MSLHDINYTLHSTKFDPRTRQQFQTYAKKQGLNADVKFQNGKWNIQTTGGDVKAGKRARAWLENKAAQFDPSASFSRAKYSTADTLGNITPQATEGSVATPVPENKPELPQVAEKPITGQENSSQLGNENVASSRFSSVPMQPEMPASITHEPMPGSIDSLLQQAHARQAQEELAQSNSEDVTSGVVDTNAVSVNPQSGAEGQVTSDQAMDGGVSDTGTSV